MSKVTLISKVMLIALLISVSAMASEIGIKGRAFSSSQCAYYSTNLADFVVTYRNDSLPWGTQIKLKYGFQNGFNSRSWERQSEIPLMAVAPYTWQTELRELTIDSRGAFASSDLQFVFEIALPDSRTIYDNGGRSDMGFYEAKIPSRTCERGELQTMPVVLR